MQVVYVGFVGHLVSFTTIHISYRSMKAAIDFCKWTGVLINFAFIERLQIKFDDAWSSRTTYRTKLIES